MAQLCSLGEMHPVYFQKTHGSGTQFTVTVLGLRALSWPESSPLPAPPALDIELPVAGVILHCKACFLGLHLLS